MLSLTHGNIPSIGSTHHTHLRRVHRFIFPKTPLKGSHESLLRQNLRVHEDDLETIQDDAQLEQLTQNGELVRLPEERYVIVDPKLPDERRFCRPWTRDFVDDFTQKYYATFHAPLVVTSAVRTVEYQEWLRRRNHNAAPEDGDTASPHLTGATIDIGKRGLSRKQLKWTRDYLLNMQNLGLADVEEEFRQRVFHITVYRDYAAYMSPAPSSQPATASAAAEAQQK
jgi:uncharacterized protein YcbK (DUF882 family)